MTHPYRADQVGSLLRPSELLAVRSVPEKRKAAEDKAILAALQKQQQVGLRIFTDGEFRREGFMSDFHESVDGLDVEGSIVREWKSDGKNQAGTGVGRIRLGGLVVGKVRARKRFTADQVAFLKQHAPGDIKVTLPTPNQFPAICYVKGVSDQAYPTYSEFLWDLVPIFRAEIQALADEGVKYIQIDAPRYSYYIDPKWRSYVKEEMGKDPDEALDEAIKIDNAILEGAKRNGIVYAMHLCRGNNRSQWYAEGGYDPIAEKLFASLNVDAFLLEYESERAGSFEPLRFVPRDKNVVLGLISSKVPEMEDKKRIIARIQEASHYIPPENLALSPQCGFASVKEGNVLTEEQQWRKLGLVVEVAREVWGSA